MYQTPFASVIKLLLLLVFVVSCVSHDLDSTTCTHQVSFAEEISPIISTNCAIEGCHNGDNGADRNWTDFGLFKQHALDVKRKLRNHEMPPPGSGIQLSDEEIQLISCWVNQGANDN